MPRKKTDTYVCDDGSYLDIDERAKGLYIAWYLPNDGNFGAYLGEDAELSPKPPNDKEGWEMWTANRAVRPLSEGRDQHGYVFETMKAAKEALAAANQALRGDSPWPQWAIKAKAAGWTPPKDWKP